ncbi:Arginase/deacetylase [Trametes versicolor FP-101664 SS1]|uniref:Arginase/deacetylase n=1 Tax=Trametes versicolor (strain FP-101664) TaxID=717944 RepID=UPI0004623E32|nr:Arginase/deacetylase [Trametes versicolor FP-101664 SS1]EIW59314.1 Arginase/deacetylase [Trametes versicolor FP-101664 SS1]
MPQTSVFLQKACLQHRYIRTRDNSHIVERPERLRAVNIGLAATVARLEEVAPPTSETRATGSTATDEDADELTKALGKLQLEAPSRLDHSARVPVAFVQSDASADLLSHPAVKFVHGDIERDVYLEALTAMAKDSQDKVNKGESEIPEGYSQGDLYLSPGSLDAIQGALGTVCEAVDAVLQASQATSGSSADSRQPSQAFVAVRPPGHHCGEDTPSGFCFVNNVAVGAAHAHLKHNINRVIIFDIDLHHGNGTQAIAWGINEETYRKQLEAEQGAPADKPGLQVYYGSIHDILSYPCEDGKAELIQAASVSIHGPHGQHVENIHLQPYASEQEFWDKLYPTQYLRLLKKAGEFIESTGGMRDDTLVFISCGFDACEHEYPSMSRHQRKVPASFYHRFARDARAFAEQYAQGRLISVLEGGYSDRALTSGAMAHLAGLVDTGNIGVDEKWWSLENLTALEAATKKRRGGRPSNTAPPEPWLARTVELFASIDSSHTVPVVPRAPIPPSNRTLRDRKPQSAASTASAKASPATSPGKKGVAKNVERTKKSTSGSESDLTDITSGSGSEKAGGESASKKLPRVILKLGPAPGV